MPADLRGGDDSGSGVPQTVRQRFALRAPVVGDDQRYVRLGVAGVAEEGRDQVLAGVLPVADDEDPSSAEQRRAEHLGEFTGDEVGRAVLPQLGLGVDRPRGRHGPADRTRHQQFLVAENQPDSGRLSRHPDILTRRSHRTRRLTR